MLSLYPLADLAIFISPLVAREAMPRRIASQAIVVHGTISKRCTNVSLVKDEEPDTAKSEEPHRGVRAASVP